MAAVSTDAAEVDASPGVPDLNRVRELLEWLDDEDVIAPQGLVDRVWSWRYMPRWRALTVWVELVDWVEWLRGTYRLSGSVKGCWYRHPDVREELLALMVAHRKAYRPGISATDCTENLTAWHTQWLWPCITRMRVWFEDCSKDRCQPSGTPLPLFCDITGEGIEEWIAADVNDRPEADDSTDHKGQLTMTGDEMRKHFSAKTATPLDPNNPDRLLRYEDADWEFDSTDKLYHRRVPPGES